MAERIPDVLLLRYLADDLSPAERTRIEREKGQSQELAQRLAELARERDAFLNTDPPAQFAHRVAVKLAHVAAPARPRWLVWILAPSSAAAMVLVLAVSYSRMAGRGEVHEAVSPAPAMDGEPAKVAQAEPALAEAHEAPREPAAPTPSGPALVPAQERKGPAPSGRAEQRAGKKGGAGEGARFAKAPRWFAEEGQGSSGAEREKKSERSPAVGRAEVGVASKPPNPEPRALADAYGTAPAAGSDDLASAAPLPATPQKPAAAESRKMAAAPVAQPAREAASAGVGLLVDNQRLVSGATLPAGAVLRLILPEGTSGFVTVVAFESTSLRTLLPWIEIGSTIPAFQVPKGEGPLRVAVVLAPSPLAQPALADAARRAPTWTLRRTP